MAAIQERTNTLVVVDDEQYRWVADGEDFENELYRQTGMTLDDAHNDDVHDEDLDYDMLCNSVEPVAGEGSDVDIEDYLAERRLDHEIYLFQFIDHEKRWVVSMGA